MVEKPPVKSMRRIAVLLGAIGLAMLAGCADDAYRLPSTAVMPAGALNTNGDIDTRSLDIAAYGFGHYDDMKGNPALWPPARWRRSTTWAGS